ncbi:MAG: ABC transporter permease [Actinomycetaceae bacterium]|nr:ABC transporter permease [Actinomycetaceae bacterium]
MSENLNAVDAKQNAGLDLDQDTTAPPLSPKPRGWRTWPLIRQWRQSFGWQRTMLTIGLAIVGFYGLLALLAPWITPFGFAQMKGKEGLTPVHAQPGGDYLMGTTTAGYDVFSRIIWGSRTAILVVLFALVLSLFIGVTLGLISGYLGGWLDRILVVFADAIYAFPSLLLAIVLSIMISGGQSSFLGGIFAAAGSITVVFVPQYFRVIRAETIRLKAEPFVESARVVGTSTPRILTRHVFRNATRSLPLIMTLNASEAILTLAGLGFLGFGIEPTAAAEWGYDLNRAVADVASGIWWTALFPGLAIVTLVLGITLVGESLNDLADPRLRIHRKPPSAKKNISEGDKAANAEPTQNVKEGAGRE